MALLGVILLLSIPQQSEINTALHLRSEAELLKQTIERSVILARETESELKLQISSTEYTLSTIGSLKQLDYHELNPATSLELHLPPPKEIHFYQSGAVSPASVRIRSTGGGLCDIRLSLRGRVTLVCS